jgi:hypothetical protein
VMEERIRRRKETPGKMDTARDGWMD